MDDLITRRAAIEAMTADNLTWNMDSVFDDDLKRAARAAQRALARLPAAQRWIPVTERLPEDGVWVLTCNDDGQMIVAKYESEVPQWEYKYFNYDWDVWDDDENGKLMAWMPLPEPPKEEP